MAPSGGFNLEDAIQVRNQVKLPLIYVGGLVSREKIDNVLSSGFDFIQIARALIHDPGFINKLRTGETSVSGCNHTNYCIAVMYSGKMACYQHQTNFHSKWKIKLERQ